MEIKKGLGHESMGPRGPGHELDKLCAAIITYYLYLTPPGPGGGGGGGRVVKNISNKSNRAALTIVTLKVFICRYSFKI